MKSEVVFVSVFLLSIFFAIAKAYGQEEFVTIKEENVPLLSTAPQNVVKIHGWKAITGKKGILGFLNGLGYSIYPDGTQELKVPVGHEISMGLGKEVMH